jgi:hypothetical protein
VAPTAFSSVRGLILSFYPSPVGPRIDLSMVYSDVIGLCISDFCVTDGTNEGARGAEEKSGRGRFQGKRRKGP